MKNTYRNTMISFGIAVVVTAGIFAGANPASQKPRGFDVGTNSVVILPAMRPITKGVWQASTAYSQGDYIRVPTNNNDVYWCVVAGTSDTSEPAWTKTADVTDNNVTWCVVDNSRSKVVIENLGSGSTVFLGFDWPAEVNKGIGLTVAGGNYSLDREAYQGEVRAISSGATNLVTTQVLP